MTRTNKPCIAPTPKTQSKTRIYVYKTKTTKQTTHRHHQKQFENKQHAWLCLHKTNTEKKNL